jgi:diguanylate cyclase (GGDEF)-like protein/PAS domain S-box-containing protein
MRGTWKDAVGHEEEWITKRLAQRAKPQNTIERQFADRYLRIHERRTADGGTIGIQIDVTELKRREISFRLLFDSNPLPMYVYDLGTLKFLAVNDAAVQFYGHSREQFLSMTILDIRPPEDRTRVKKDAQSPTTDLTGLTTRHSKADGRVVDILLYKSMLTYEGQRASLVSVTDITERKRAEARITHMAHHDGLTDLANRALFRERLEQSLAQDQTDGKKLALHCIDLDYFKNVNDTLGHPVGDALLRRVADRLRACVRETDIVARLGGDEFAIIQDGIGEATEASHLATRIIEALNEPYDIDGHEVIISASIGIAAPLPGERNPDQLLKNADVALYRVKNDGRHSYRFFEPEMDAQLQARRAIEIDLRLALSREEFEVHYQPLVDTGIGEVNGFEALLRWNRPGHGIVSPAEFIPLAEEIGLIVPLGEWVLRKACAEAVSWPKNMTVSVNLSPLQFRSGNLLQTVITALAVTGLPAQRLELEITESVLFQDDDVNLATLHQLRQLGVRIAMDDFGTGYSSLSYLRDFPFDRIKIDRSFVKELVDNPDCLTIACGIIGLATGLGMKTTAEGVETTEQMELLKAHGCNHMQGFLFGAAKPVQEIHAFLDELRRKEESVA